MATETRYFCDRCGVEELNRFKLNSFVCHYSKIKQKEIDKLFKNNKLKVKYHKHMIDRIVIDLCDICMVDFLKEYG